jgi:hypothetical protein
MRYIQISPNLSLVAQEIKTKKVVSKRECVNHLWIYDRSGSMTYSLPELTNQLVSLSKTLPKGDTLSLGWFSGEGDYNWVIKGFKIADSSDYKNLEKMIRANSSSRNTTCFSEILSNTSQVVADLSVFSSTFSLHFFTDGYPVVSNHRKELDSIFTAISALKGKIYAACLVGYGAYYNKELMSDMAARLGAVLLHSSVILDYQDSVGKLMKLIDISEPKIEIEPVVSHPLAIFSVSPQGVTTYSFDNGKLYVSPIGESTNIFYISGEKPNVKSWDKVDVASLNFADPKDTLATAMYAAALVLSQRMKTDIALEFLGKIGDKHLVDSFTNAYTTEEYGIAESSITPLLTDVTGRFSGGKDTNYLPPSDAFCVFDLLNMLVEDEWAAFYPHHPKFEYTRISTGAKTKEGYPEFSPNVKSQCRFENLTWHSSRLNLSVLTRIEGHVDLIETGVTLAEAGFANPYPCFVFRNYSFIKDGRVNVKSLYLTSSEETYKDLKNRGIVIDDTYATNREYGLDISRLPSINRSIATGKTSASDLCELAWRENSLKAEVKALKWLREEKAGDATAPVSFTTAQCSLLEANGIDPKKGGLFDPPTDKAEATDQYMAKSFEIKIQGLMSLPPVKKVAEKIEKGKARTPVEELIETGLILFEGAKFNGKFVKNGSKEDIRSHLDIVIKLKQMEMRKIRTTMQQTKFAVILGKAWFDEFTTRDNPTLEYKGHTYKFELGEEVVEI